MVTAKTLGLATVLVLAVPTYAPVATAAAGGVEAPPSIASDCSRDVSLELARFLSATPPGSVVALAPSGCYLVQTEVRVDGLTDVVIDGRGAMLRRTEPTPDELRYPSANAFLRLVNASDVTVRALAISGTNTVSDLEYLRPDFGAYDRSMEFDHGLALNGPERVTVRDVSIDAVFGDGITVAGFDQYTSRDANHVVITDVTVTRNGRQGIAVSTGTDILIDRARVLSSRRSGIDLEPNTVDNTIATVEVRNSEIRSQLLAFASYGPGLVNDVWIHHNVVRDSGVPMVYVRSSRGLQRRGWRVEYNSTDAGLGSPMPALAFWNTVDVTVTGNRFVLADLQPTQGLGLWEGSVAVVNCNWFRNSPTPWLDIDDSSRWTGANNVTGDQAPICSAPAPEVPGPAEPGPVDPVVPEPATPALPPVGRVNSPEAASAVPGARPAREIARPTVRRGSRGARVREVQLRLGVRATGYFGPATQQAVRGFQRAVGLPRTGVVAGQTWRALFARTSLPTRATTPSLRPGSRGPWVREAQRLLGVRQTGYYNRAMSRLVRSYQRTRGLPLVGVIGPRTWQALRSRR